MELCSCEIKVHINLSLGKTINKESDLEKIKNESKIIFAKYEHHLHIYTDGSKIENKTGCAFYIPDLKIEKQLRISDETSIFKAELIAILEALSYIENNPPSLLVIFSDSLCSLKAIKNFENNNNVINEIRYKLYNLDNNHISTTLVWIPGHSGIENNERADILAKRSTQFKF